MKFFTNKETTKKVIIAILLVMSFNFISPISSQALFDTPRGGKLFEPLFQFTCFIGDLFIKGMQYIFMGDGDIMEEDSTVQGGKTFYIEYSPGAIFSNKVAALDVNFFDPGKYKKTTEKPEFTKIREDEVSNSTTKPTEDEVNSARDKLLQGTGYTEEKAKKVNEWSKEVGEKTEVWEWDNNNKIYRYIKDSFTKNSGGMSFTYGYYLELYEQNEQTVVEGEEIKSSAATLQKTVSTWYKALRAFALVGLLSVLVYIGIRILISSTGQEKAKYKKMIMDWVAAICILFVLQYIMIFTLKITESITKILSVSVIGEDGRDDLMSDIRGRVGGDDETEIDYTNFETFINTIMYLALVIETGIFTVHYLKRLVYMAFFTMIAPLVALTYPLDKIKDGQAQAFGTLIREYIFNALIQPVHLLLYYIFISSASSLVDGNPLYAVVALGFMMPAEKFFRKMFGFEKASSVSQVGAAAGGALVMNAINKMGQNAGKQAAGKTNAGGSSSSGSASGTRTQSGNAIDMTTGNISGGSGVQGNLPAPSSVTGNSGTNNSQANAFGSGNGIPGNAPGAKPKIGGFSAGAKAVGRKYFNANTAKKVGRMARRGLVGGLGAATAGTIGLAAGVATGDMGNVFKYGAAGMGAGYMGANYAVDKGISGLSNLNETFQGGYQGQDAYNNKKLDKEFFASDEYRNMLNNPNLMPGVKDRTSNMKKYIQECRDNGITDTQQIAAVMQMGLDSTKGAYAIRLADSIGKSGWNNDKVREGFKNRYNSRMPAGFESEKIWDSVDKLLS